MSHRRGFSLVELLVVLGIIALLTAFVYPVIAAARERGRLTQCLSQLSQLAKSTQMYLADYSETYPLAAFLSSNGNRPCLFTLYHALSPYTQSPQLLVCPSDPAPLDIVTTLAQMRVAPLCPLAEFRYSSYTANWCLIETGTLLGDFHPPLSTAGVEFPSETALYYDGSLSAFPGLFPYIQGRHDEKLGIVFADGHARQWRTRRGYGTVKRVDGRSEQQFCLIEPSAYYRGGIYCEDMIIGLVRYDRKGQPCWFCPNRYPGSVGYLDGNCQ